MRLLSDAELLLVSGADGPPTLTQFDHDTGELVSGIQEANNEGLLGIPFLDPAGAAATVMTTIGNWDNSATYKWAHDSNDPAAQALISKLGADLAANPFTQQVKDDIAALRNEAIYDGAVNDETSGSNGSGGTGGGGNCGTTYGGTGGGGTPNGSVTVPYDDTGWS
jgi:hypothetical protein